MGKRHRARECALQCLYQWDTTRADLDGLLAGFWESQGTPDLPDDARRFAERLTRGTVARVGELDRRIEQQADNWRLERMGRVDLNILRLGLYEMLEETTTPDAVVIDEAVELAKRFSGPEAAPFVNGVLDGLRRRLQEDKEALRQ